MPLNLNQECIAIIHDHAEQDFPNECCGFLVGKIANLETSIVSEIVRAKNTRHDRPQNRFEIDPGELVRTDKAARSAGNTVIGFYHSHPNSPAVPSEFDREHAWPGYCYVIVSVIEGRSRSTKNFKLLDDRSAFEVDPIVIEETTNDVG